MHKATAYFFKPADFDLQKQLCVRCHGSCKIEYLVDGMKKQMLCTDCGGSGSVDLRPIMRRYVFGGGYFGPSGSWIQPTFPSNFAYYMTKDAEFPDANSAMAWLQSWSGKIIEQPI